MVPMLSELWRWTLYLLRPEDNTGAGQHRPPVAAPFAGAVKTLFWACLAVLAGLGLARLGA